MPRNSARRRVTRLTVGGKRIVRGDHLTIEEPLEIRVHGRSLAVTMRTPGHDFELAAGFLVSEGVVHTAEDFATARYCAGSPRPAESVWAESVWAESVWAESHASGPHASGPHASGPQASGPQAAGSCCTGAHRAGSAAPSHRLPEPLRLLPEAFGATAADGGNTYNVLDVVLGPGVAPPDPSIQRNFTTTSSCGLCGKASIDTVRTASRFEVSGDDLRLAAETLAGFPDALREGQAVFERTGGLHAAALFDGGTGEMLVLREDVGRHNAVDKVVGWALMNGRIPARNCVLMVSGRASFELTQKSLMAGIPMLAAVSAPSSLAADLADEAGLTLVGFLRGPSMVIYSRPDRIVDE